MPVKNSKRLTVDIPEKLHRQLKIGAINRDISMNELIRKLLIKELSKDETKPLKTRKK